MHHPKRPAHPISRLKTSRAILAGSVFALCLTGVSHAQLAIGDTGLTYSIDFDSTLAGVGEGVFAGAGFQPTPTVGQLDSDAWAVTGWSDGALAFGGTRTTLDYARGNAAGAVTTGGFYGFTGGSIGAGRALGIQPGGSDWAPGTLTLRIQNTSASTITGFNLGYELHVRNDQARSNSFNFLRSSDDSAYIAEPTLDFTSTAAADALGFVMVSRSITLSGLTIPAGAFYYLRWAGADAGGSGSRDEFALDDIVFSTFTTGSAPKNLVWNPAVGPGGNTWNLANTNWLDGVTPSAFTSIDTVNFTDTGLALGSTVVVDAGGVSPNAMFVSNTTGTYTLSGGAINGTATLTKSGAGTLIISNSFNAGGITVTDGVAKTSASDLIADAASLKVGGAGTFDLDGNSDTVGALTFDGGGTLATGVGTITLGGDITLTANNGTANITGNVNVGATGTRTINVPNGTEAVDAQIDANLTGGARFAIAGTGTVVLNGDNSGLSGGITIPNNGNVEIGNNNALGTGTLFLNGGTTNFTTEMLGALAIPTPVSIGGNATFTGSDVEWSGSFAFAFAGAQSRTLTIENQVLLSGAVSGSDDTLSLTGIGSVTLSGTNTLATLNVNGIPVFVNGATTVSGTANIIGGGVLSGGGSLIGAVAVTDGTIAPGRGPLDSPDGTVTLTVGNLTIGSTGFFGIQINDDAPGQFDILAVNGTVNLDPSSGLTITAGILEYGSIYAILQNDGTDPIVGEFFGKSEGSTFSVLGGQEFVITYAGGTDNNDIVLTAVPEPGSTMLLLGGLAMLGARRRRKA